ncbi:MULTISPECIES: polyphosphate polymerase domain-containing protein [unclassified Aureispira]|uniref:polyphosphate polymerase domain-containing protein n=1 Tax=unclassified Aureispira TaxID=2649989 RepID=UPI0006968E1F|nr:MULTISPECIES: polyphosphate polymerase domain-containing protein [unclassified Aureispira]WMX17293.1 polyphosphate polymerase domain-containing protein [Aureispira sp. CCB-E]
MIKNDLVQLLRKFEPISLKEMDRVKLMNRVETKFLFGLDQLMEILEELMDDYQVVKIDGNMLPAYRSLYFDNAEFFFYNEHHRERTSRYKVRYRTYVDSNLSFLEVKHKYKGRTNKKRIKVEDMAQEMPEPHRNFLKELMVPKADLQPVMMNTYNRITLVAKHAVERLTLDINLNFEFGNKQKELKNIVIAELKQERITRDSPFYKVVREKEMRPYRISKYCMGIIHLYGQENIKYNRFKKKLLRLNNYA